MYKSTSRSQQAALRRGTRLTAKKHTWIKVGLHRRLDKAAKARLKAEKAAYESGKQKPTLVKRPRPSD